MIGFKKLKLLKKEKKKKRGRGESKKAKKKKRKTPQNCKSPIYRQWFIRAIKNVTEKEKKRGFKILNRFHSANKIDKHNGGWGGGGKKERKTIPKNLSEQVKT